MFPQLRRRRRQVSKQALVCDASADRHAGTSHRRPMISRFGSGEGTVRKALASMWPAGPRRPEDFCLVRSNWRHHRRSQISSAGVFDAHAGSVRERPVESNQNGLYGSSIGLLFVAMIGHHFSISARWKERRASGVCCSRGKISCPISASCRRTRSHQLMRPRRTGALRKQTAIKPPSSWSRMISSSKSACSCIDLGRLKARDRDIGISRPR
jgi:hypothetical protein